MKLPPGKIPKEILEEVIFKNLGAKREEVTVGPLAGIDGAVVEAGDKSLIVSMDPITGALETIGWLAVNINANDVATFGVQPTFFLSCIMLPEKSEEKTVQAISTQMDRAARTLGIAIVGGHCETTPELANPIVVGCAIGMTDRGKYVTAGGAKPGDKLILTKSAGIEGTAILATDRKEQLKKTMDLQTLQSAADFYKQISVVEDAITAFQSGGVNAMHDPTEGGIAGGTHEIADASNLGFKIHEERIRIKPETSRICEFFQIDPLCLISSGALLISVRPESADKIVRKLKDKNIKASVIGEFVSNPDQRAILRKKGKTETLPKPVSDHLWLALQKTEREPKKTYLTSP